jgi:hypothetical protein
MQRHQKPSTGVMGRKYWLEDNMKLFNNGSMSHFIRVHKERLTALESAIIRYRDVGLTPLPEWEEERNEINAVLVLFADHIRTYYKNCKKVLDS